MSASPRNDMAGSTTLSISLPAPLHRALQDAMAAQTCEASLIVQRALVVQLAKEGFLPEDEKRRFELFWKLVGHVVKKAQHIAKEGTFPESVTLDAINAAMKDNWWVSGYRDYIGTDIFRTGVPEKGPLNREIGFRVKEALGAQVKKDSNGKTANTKVLGSVIQSYTPLLPG